MRLVTYEIDSVPRAAAVKNGGYVDLNRADSQLPVDLKDLVAGWPRLKERADAAVHSGEILSAESVRILPPIPAPTKIICVGINYAEHARESGVDPPAEPILFSKFPSALIAAGDAIVLPPVSKEVDYEAELVVVIGAGGRNIPREEALSRVGGYCCGHDVSARDWQLHKPGGQWLMGKTFDTFAPVGPELVTADEVGDPGQLDIKFRLNGETMQDSNTREFIFGVEEVIEYVSSVCTLLPGDIIFTGTPSGVGAGRKPPVFLKPGDVAEVEIEKLGVLRNPVVGT